MPRKDFVSKKKPEKPSKFFVISAEMRPIEYRSWEHFLHAELVGGPDRLQAEDKFMNKMRVVFPDHTVGMMTTVPVTEEQEDQIIDHVQRRRGLSTASSGHGASSGIGSIFISIPTEH
jgi:hypothetical protein